MGHLLQHTCSLMIEIDGRLQYVPNLCCWKVDDKQSRGIETLGVSLEEPADNFQKAFSLDRYVAANIKFLRNTVLQHQFLLIVIVNWIF